MVMNMLTTLKEDDMAFSLMEGVWTPVRSLGDLFHSHINQFLHANGRTANLVAALFCTLLGKTVFNVCNTLVFGFLSHMMSLLATGRRSLLALSIFLVAVGTCYPVPGETMLWLDGSCNYMWAIALSLALIYYLQRQHRGALGWGGAALLFLVSFVAGSFNEATSFGVLIGLAVYYAVNRSQWDRRALISLTGYLLGVALIVASPGAWARAASGDIVVNLPFIDLLHSRWYIFSEKMWRFYLPIVAALVGIVALFLHRGRALRQSPWTWIFLGMAVVLFVLGQTSERTYAPFVTVALIIITIAADRVFRQGTWARLLAITVCLLLAGFTAARGLVQLNRYKAYDNQTVNEILAAPDQVVLRERMYDGYSRFIKPMNFMSTNFFAHEDIYRAFFGKRNIQFVSDSIYERYHEGRLLDGAKEYVPKSNYPKLTGSLYSFDDQGYIALEILSDNVPSSYQTAEFHDRDAVRQADLKQKEIEELQRRRNYGINIDYDPAGFYPLMYQGHCYLICTAPSKSVDYIVFPIWFHSDDQVIPLKITLN